MPFIKPETPTFDVVMVGDDVSEMSKIISCYWAIKQNRLSYKASGANRHQEKWTYVYTKKGFQAKINIWLAVPGQKESNMVSNFFHGANIAVITCDYQCSLYEMGSKASVALENWIHMTSKECSDATKILMLFHEKDVSISTKDLRELALKYQCAECLIVSYDKEPNSIGLLQQTFHKYLFEEESVLYNNLEAELKLINLASDKQTLTNTTQCYERNGIA